jgi:hypothetical protein
VTDPTAREDTVWRALQEPLVAVVVAVVLVAVAFVLDATSGVARDYALVVGAPALYVLLPATLLWLVIAVVRYALGARRRGGGPGRPEERTNGTLGQ